jgi:hypothetical protein
MKTILHLCADIGSDSYPYATDPDYEVIKIGKDIGVENYSPDRQIHGVIANPVCTEFSIARGFHKETNTELGLEIVHQCLRIIEESSPEWWVLENPASGKLKNEWLPPKYLYEPWWYGSPWTKKTALWGNFIEPQREYYGWDYVPKNNKLYVRPGRPKTSLAFLHKSAIHNIPEFAPFIPLVHSDADFRSLCSQNFARAFKLANP